MRKAGGFGVWKGVPPGAGETRLLVLLEIVLLPEDGLDGVVLVGEISLEAGAEVDVPPPDAAEH